MTIISIAEQTVLMAVISRGEPERNVLFNDALNTFYLCHMASHVW